MNIRANSKRFKSQIYINPSHKLEYQTHFITSTLMQINFHIILKYTCMWNIGFIFNLNGTIDDQLYGIQHYHACMCQIAFNSL